MPLAGAALEAQAAEDKAAEWAVLRPALMRQVRAWLDPGGARGWHDDDGAVADSEALTAVLSLYRFLLLRESAMGSDYTGTLIIVSMQPRCMHALARPSGMHP